jgi:DNA helicase HerA-like ATPase
LRVLLMDFLMNFEDAAETSASTPGAERRTRRVIGHLVSLNGMHGVIACEMNGLEPGDYWSVGNLISVVHEGARLVGQVCDIATADQRWRADGVNQALVKIELTGEIVDEAPGRPVFYRGIRSFPTLGAIAHRIRAADLRAIFAVHNTRVVEIGALTQNPTISATVSVEELTRRHFAVVGSTGVGKTTSVSMLIKQCVRELPKLRVMIVDPHNEYSAHFRNQAYLLDSDNLELPYWMFRFEEIMDIVYSGRKPNPDEADALYEVIRTAKQRFAGGGRGVEGSTIRRNQPQELAGLGADTPVPYRVSDATQILDDWAGKLDPRYARADLRTLRNRLDALSHDPRYRFMFGKVMVEDNMARVIGSLFRLPLERQPVTIVQVGGLPNEVVNAVVSVLARLAFEVASACHGETPVALLCEEAHRYIPSNQSLGFEPTRRAIGRIAKEGRKYGASLCIVTQRPSELDSTVLSQCSTMFAMRLSSERDKDIMVEAAGASSEGSLNFLSSLADREAIAFGEAIPTPMRMKFSDYRQFNKLAENRPPRLEETAERSRELLRLTVARMRGEAGQTEAPTPAAVKMAG